MPARFWPAHARPIHNYVKTDNMDSNDYIFGIHPALEAIEAGRTIDKLFIKKDLHGDLAIRLTRTARERGIPVQRVPVERLNRITRKNHQGVIAQIAAVDYARLGDIVPTLFEEGVVPFILVLDGITDVRNFGAIARTAECCGVNAIVIGTRVCREDSLLNAVKYLQSSGCQIVCSTEKASENYTLADFTTPVALVMGAEDTGISNEILQVADTRAAIPMFGHIGSLNVGVAAGVMMYEVVRQRLKDNMEIV